nr:hypothetical protein [uncultured Acetatifactor sp.]
MNAQFDGSPLIWIRKDWMEKLNLEAPKSLADLEMIAKAFMEEDPDGNGQKDTYGFPSGQASTHPMAGTAMYATSS